MATYTFPVIGRVDLDGTHRVIIETTRKSFDFPQAETLFVKLTANDKSCGVVVNAIQVEAEEDALYVDRYKLQHLEAKDGDPVRFELFSPPSASEVVYSAADLARRDQVRFIGKPFATGERSAVFTFSGEPRPFTVKSIEPGGMAVIAPSTRLSEAKDESGPVPVSYGDIGGLGSELKLIRETIEYPFKHRELFAHLGVNAPKGIILHGPPGTGKTLIARALASEIGANYYSISGPEIYSKWYGNSEQSLRNIFNEAIKNAPSIVVIDELDSLVPRRDSIHGDQEQRIVATFLTQMDGLKALKDVVVVGTTNRINEIDPALRRGGRFEQEIYVGVPDNKGREEIMKIHVKRMPLGADIDLSRVAELANGFTGADLNTLCREAAYVALRRTLPQGTLETGQTGDPCGHEAIVIGQDDFLAALNSVQPSAGREYTLDTPKVRWDEIGGLDEVKQLLIENLQHAVQHKDAFDKVGIRAAGGILLHGPPGTGKTLLARAIANECDTNFIGIKGSDIRDRWIGESEQKIRNLFQKARMLAPCVIFFDEIDTILRRRGGDQSGVSDAIVNQLLAEMDGIEECGSIFVIGATNRIESMDPAVLRPGRFDYHVHIALPGAPTRARIFEVHLKGKPMDQIDYGLLAAATECFSGAQIAEVCREAAWHSLRAAHYDADQVQITMEHLNTAILRMQSMINPGGVR